MSDHQAAGNDPVRKRRRPCIELQFSIHHKIDGTWALCNDQCHHMGWATIQQEPSPSYVPGSIPPDHVWRPILDRQGGAVEIDSGQRQPATYVGRAFLLGHLLPARVTPAHAGAYVGWGDTEHYRHLGAYEVLHLPRGNAAWEPASDGDIPPHAFPVGCTVQGLQVFVGRVKYLNTVTLGRLIPNEGACIITHNRKEMRCSEYEVLTIC